MLYVNQKVRVWSKPGDANGEIRVTFNEMNPEPVTLALTLVEASWLAALVGAEIRRVERGESTPEPRHPCDVSGNYPEV